jgi:hypothetical protein
LKQTGQTMNRPPAFSYRVIGGVDQVT